MNRLIQAGIRILIASTAAAFVSCGGSTDVQPVSKQNSAQNSTSKSSVYDLVRIMNVERAKRGRGPLTVDSRLMRSAQGHSNSMNKYGYFAHKGRDGSTPQKRMMRAGYPRCFCAENLALATTASQANGLWMRSPSHRKSLLSKKYARVGVGKSGRYWTAHYAEPMGAPGGGGNLPPPAYSYTGGF